MPWRPASGKIAYRPAGYIYGADTVIICISNIERTAAYGYAYRVVKLRGGACAVGVPWRLASGKIAYRPAGYIYGADTVIICISNIERTAAYGYAYRAVKLRGGTCAVGVPWRPASGKIAYLCSSGGSACANQANAIIA